jgi:glycosyltransferase involved in cell wall biosynthesis
MVVCYENAALETFRAARAIGAVCVLDAAAVHYASARSWGGAAVRGNPPWVERRKQQEIELADAILACSKLAAETYRDAGIPPASLHAVPLGAELPDHVARVPSSGAACSFVFAGTIRRLKGVDLLLDVFAAFEQENVAARLTLIGSAVEPDLVRRASRMANVTCLPFMPQNRLLEELARHDCLVLPSRFDAFGMVVAEAMAVGLPALVTDRVGAKCIIEDHPGAGWVVECDTAALKAQLLSLIEHRAALEQASTAARAAAQDYSWPRYRQRAVAALRDIHARHAKPGR